MVSKMGMAIIRGINLSNPCYKNNILSNIGYLLNDATLQFRIRAKDRKRKIYI